MNTFLSLSQEVKDAQRRGVPIVALESTIIAHGMPYPQNLETAKEVGAIIREAGAIPATIAIIKGKLKVGLTLEEMEVIARHQGMAKVSRRDLPIMVARKQDGATTVAATMIIAHMAGLEVFVTGGIGGVHRKGEQTMDVSADLQELANTNLAVVCAGAKSILDIGRTLEYLETRGVPVIGYQTDEFPAFYTRKSGFQADARADTPTELAGFVQAKKRMHLKGGLIIANPVPKADEMDQVIIDNAIAKALSEAEQEGVTGKDITPFLLARIKTITAGSSLKTNISLIKNNARLGAALAVAIAETA